MYDFRTGNDTRGPVKDPLQWQSTLALVSYRGACLEGISSFPWTPDCLQVSEAIAAVRCWRTAKWPRTYSAG